MGKLILSPSQVKDWKTCRLKWAFRIEGVPPDTEIPHLRRGSEIHKRIEEGESEELVEFYRRVQPEPEVLEREMLVEAPLSYRKGTWVIVRGRIDALAKLSGRLVVVDYKTGKRRPKRLRYQLIYPLLVYRALGQKPVEMVVEYLDDYSRYRTDPWPEMEGLVREYEEIAQEIKEQMAKGAFPPQPGFHCRFCGYRQRCLEIYPPEDPTDLRIRV